MNHDTNQELKQDLKQDKKAAAYRVGIVVLIVLTILTAAEYIIAINMANATVLLFIMALLKAAPILQVFMHVSSLWSEEEGH